jgi:hypothetical protein
MSTWLRLALRRDVVNRAIKVSLIVGSILIVINYGDVMIAGETYSAMVWKIPLTYAVPYCVATYASVEALRV